MNMSYNSINLSLIILTILLLHACAKTHHSETLSSPIKQPSQIHVSQKTPKQTPKPDREISHTVLKGETLASIAKRYGYTETELARSNGIVPPYTILPGEILIIPGPIKLHGYNYEAIPVIIPPPPKPEPLNN